MRSAVLVALLAMSSTAGARSPTLSPSGISEPAPLRLTRAPKRRETAAVWALAGTLTPVLVVGYGSATPHPLTVLLLSSTTAMLLPSAGHWYAGEGFITTGMRIRVLGGGLAAIMGFLLMASDGDHGKGYVLAFDAGLLTLAVGAGYDIVTAPAAVDRWNAKHATLAPAPMKLGEAYGLGMVGTF